MSASDIEPGFRAARAGVLRELAPRGKLRVGLVSAPAASAFFVALDSNGQPRGVTVELGDALARSLAVPVEFAVAANSGEITADLRAGELDVSFMPIDEERRQAFAVGPAYFVVENTYLVRPGSDIATIPDVDRPGVRVIGIANTTTIRNTARLLRHTTISPVRSVGEALELLRSERADAFALTHDSLPPLAAALPGSRILDGSYQRTEVAAIIAPGKPQALACLTQFMEHAKSSGLVRRAFDDAGLHDAVVAAHAR